MERSETGGYEPVTAYAEYPVPSQNIEKSPLGASGRRHHTCPRWHRTTGSTQAWTWGIEMRPRARCSKSERAVAVREQKGIVLAGLWIRNPEFWGKASQLGKWSPYSVWGVEDCDIHFLMPRDTLEQTP